MKLCAEIWRASLRLQCVAMLERAQRIGIQPNTVMRNTAMSALGKAGRPALAVALFEQMPARDAVSYETLIAAHGEPQPLLSAQHLLTFPLQEMSVREVASTL